jgi:hypothetical protein
MAGIGNWPLPPIADGGGGAAYNITATTGTYAYTAKHPDISAYEAGMILCITFSRANIDAVTLNVNNLGVLPVLGDNNAQLKPGEIAAHSTHLIIHDGTRFKILSQRAVLSALQLATPLTGYSRNLGAKADISYNDSILSALGKALTLNSPLTGYEYGPYEAIKDTDTIREAFGKIQNQLYQRYAWDTPMNNFEAGENAPVVSTDSFLTALKKFQGQINARPNGVVKKIQRGNITHINKMVHELRTGFNVDIEEVNTDKALGFAHGYASYRALIGGISGWGIANPVTGTLKTHTKGSPMSKQLNITAVGPMGPVALNDSTAELFAQWTVIEFN